MMLSHIPLPVSRRPNESANLPPIPRSLHAMNSPASDSAPTDTELITRSQAGERSAFAALVKRHQSAACSVAYSACGDFMASEDAAQEAFVLAWRRLQDLRDTGRFRAWVCGIARKLALSHLRRRTRRGEGVSADTLAEPIAETADPSDEAAAAEELAMLWQTLETLPANYRDPLVLFYREQQSVAAVASALELTEEVARQRLSRGRTLLRDAVTRRLESTLARTEPGATFTAGVMAVLPPVSASLPATAATGAKAAATGAWTLGTWVSGAVGLLGIWAALRYSRSSLVPAAVRRIYIWLTVAGVLVSVSLGALVAWIGANKGSPLIDAGLSPALVLAMAVLGCAGSFAAIAILGSRIMGKHFTEPTPSNRLGHRYVSQTRIAGLPLLSIAIGPAGTEKYGTARGWIAIGEFAYGFLAIGGVAVGSIAVGGICAGIFALGGTAFGMLAGGMIAAGYIGVGCLATGWQLAIGAVAAARELAVGAVAAASHQAAGLVAIAPTINETWLSHAEAFLPYVGWVSLLTLPAIVFLLRQTRK